MPASTQPIAFAELIADVLPRLPAKQQRIARFLAANEGLSAFTSAKDIAGRLRVDPATVVRLAQALGFQGYPDLQRHLRARYPHHYPSSSPAASPVPASNGAPPSLAGRAFAQDFENLRQCLELLDDAAITAACDAIGRARRTLVFGSGVATGVVEFLASSLRTMGLPAAHLTADGLPLIQELVLLQPDDLAFGVGFYRYAGQTASVLKRAGELGVPSIVLTDSLLSPLAPLADHALCAPVESVSHRVSLVAPMAVVNALIARCAERHPEKVNATLRRLDDEYRRAGLLSHG